MNLKPHIMQILFIFLVLCLFPISGNAKTDIKKIEKKISTSIDKEIETQKINENWSIEKNRLSSQYENLTGKNEVLNKRLKELEKIFSHEQAKNNEFIRKANEVKRIENELHSLLENIIAELEIFIKKDLPFHNEERIARLNNIKEEILMDESRPAEKFRQVFEALRIETDFGKSVEVYNKKIQIDAGEKLASVLRIGRVSLFALTADKKTAAKYDPLNKKWLVVDSKLKKEIEKGILTAKGEKTAELVKLPFGRIER